MERNQKSLFILFALYFLLTLLAPVTTAFAATQNHAVSVPKVLDDSENTTLGTLAIREDEDLDGWFRAGDVITINLPSGVEYNTAPNTTADYVYNEADNAYVYSEDGVALDIIVGTDNYISFQIKDIGDGKASESRIYVCFNKNKGSGVDIDEGVTGDIDVEIDAAGTSITSEYITVARIVAGNPTATISRLETIDGNRVAKEAGDSGVISTGPAGGSSNVRGPQITVNSQPVKFNVAPEIKHSRTFGPIRDLAYSLGVPEDGVAWDGITKTATIIKGELVLNLIIGSNLLLVNEEPQKMDVAPYIKESRTMAPVRFIAEALGASVGWDEKNRQIIIKQGS